MSRNPVDSKSRTCSQVQSKNGTADTKKQLTGVMKDPAEMTKLQHFIYSDLDLFSLPLSLT